MKTIHITSQDDLPDVAEAVIEALGRRTVVAFRGEMGAGKTTLIREIAAQLGATDTVTSPTFAIVNQYKGKGGRRIHHFDFYRINDVRGTHHRGQRHGPHVRDRLTLRACTYARQHAPLHRAGCRAVHVPPPAADNLPVPRKITTFAGGRLRKE